MENSQDKNLIRSVLTTEVKWILGVIMFVFGIASPYFGITKDIALIQKDISTINSNHEVHIQDILQQLKEMKQEQLDLQKQILIISNHQN